MAPVTSFNGNLLIMGPRSNGKFLEIRQFCFEYLTVYTSLYTHDASMESRTFSESACIGVVCVMLRMLRTGRSLRVGDADIWLLVHKGSCLMNNPEQ
jgi:hypothetical protein